MKYLDYGHSYSKGYAMAVYPPPFLPLAMLGKNCSKVLKFSHQSFTRLDMYTARIDY